MSENSSKYEQHVKAELDKALADVQNEDARAFLASLDPLQALQFLQKFNIAAPSAAAASLTDAEREYARQAGMTPEQYAAFKAPKGGK